MIYSNYLTGEKRKGEKKAQIFELIFRIFQQMSVQRHILQQKRPDEQDEMRKKHKKTENKRKRKKISYGEQCSLRALSI